MLDSEICCVHPQPGTSAVWWLGQSGYAIRSHYGGVILVDPFLSDSISHGYRPYTHERLVPAPLDWHHDSLKPEAVLITHEHQDHCDNVYLTRLAQSGETRFIGPPPVCERLELWDIDPHLITAVSPGTHIQLSWGLLTVVKSVHTAQAVGYVLDATDGPRIYVAGDTGLFLGMRQIGDLGLDCAILPINGQYDNLGIDGALEALKLLMPTIAIPCHFGMFADNTECPERLAYAVRAAQLPIEVKIPKHAEMMGISSAKSRHQRSP